MTICTRCQGCVIPERLSDVLDDSGEMGFGGWRCLNCGDVFDRVVLQHRHDGAPAPYRSQRRWSGAKRAARPAGKTPQSSGQQRGNIVVA